MNKIFDEDQLRAVLKAAKNCRMEQLESKFAALKEYLETTEEKESLINQMEELMPYQGKPILGRYDDVGALQLSRAQDFFYEWGFSDFLSILRFVLGEVGEKEVIKFILDSVLPVIYNKSNN